MFGHNRVVTPKAFAEVSADTLQVTSIFGPTIQGEGPFAGETAMFVRLTGCNLQCSFCDTYFDQGDHWSFESIFYRLGELLTACYGNQTSNWQVPLLLVITGGEPMMQRNLTDFVYAAEARKFRIQIESNGNFWVPLPASTHLVISPKINEKTKRFIRLDALALEWAETLKFIISADMEGYQDIPRFALDWRRTSRKRIYVSPMNTYTRLPMKLGPDGTLEQRSETDERISFWEEGLLDRETNRRNHEHAARIAIKHGAILTLQQHLYANLP
jgi:7-carboxy-7-deazaguanine synthase